MTRENKLNNIIVMLDFLAKLDEKFWIDKSNFNKLYIAIANIKDEEKFNEAYKLIIENIAVIFDRLPKLWMKIDKIKKKNEENINKLEDNKILLNIEKKFNI